MTKASVRFAGQLRGEALDGADTPLRMAVSLRDGWAEAKRGRFTCWARRGRAARRWRCDGELFCGVVFFASLVGMFCCSGAPVYQLPSSGYLLARLSPDRNNRVQRSRSFVGRYIIRTAPLPSSITEAGDSAGEKPGCRGCLSQATTVVESGCKVRNRQRRIEHVGRTIEVLVL